MNFTFSILHYKTYDDTYECVKSILALNDKANIVIVDNGSNNGSFEKLKNKFKDDNIHFIDNNMNIGFAKANNIGYKYAKDVLKSEYIAVVNNDVIIESKDFIERIVDNFNKDRFYICGPNIINIDGITHQNPMIKNTVPKNKIISTYLKYRLAYYLCKIGFYEYFIRYSNDKEEKEAIEWQNKKEDIQLHGSFIIYSPLYIKKEDYAFYPGTFLYMEENILYYMASVKDYKIMYYPNITIIHKGGSSTKNVVNSNKNAYMFRLNNISKSLLVLKEVMNKYNK